MKQRFKAFTVLSFLCLAFVQMNSIVHRKNQKHSQKSSTPQNSKHAKKSNAHRKNQTQ